MRISFGHQYDVYRNDLSRTQGRYFDAQRKVSTGKRIFALSDDPFGAASALSMRQVRAASEQYATNAQSARSFLAFSEGTLSEMSKLFKRVNELAVSGANASTDQVGRQAMVTELVEVQRRLVDLANSKGPNESYLFAGQATDVKPFTAQNGTLQFHGDNGELRAEVSATETIAYNTQLAGPLATFYQNIESLKDNLSSGNVGAISDIDLADIQGSIKTIDQMRGDIGARIQTAEQSISNHQRRMDELTSRISNVEDVDMAEAILEYKTAETAYQAALQTVSMGSQLTLMDYLR